MNDLPPEEERELPVAAPDAYEDEAAINPESADETSTTADATVEMLIATFPDEATAAAAFDTLMEAQKQDMLLTLDMALVQRDEKNQIHIRESQEAHPGATAGIGAGIGAILGMIGGPLGLVIGGAVGAAIGGAAATLSDSGIPHDRLRKFGDALRPGSSMVLVAVAEYWRDETQQLLETAGGAVSVQQLPPDIAHRLRVA